MDSLQVREFIATIQTVITNSSLPLEVINIILKTISADVENMANAEIQQLLIDREERENNSNE